MAPVPICSPLLSATGATLVQTPVVPSVVDSIIYSSGYASAHVVAVIDVADSASYLTSKIELIDLTDFVLKVLVGAIMQCGW